jgi:hypothetical protein
MAINNHSDAIGISAAVLATVAGIMWIVYGLRHAFSYPLRDSRMDIRILGLTVQHIPFSDIEKIEVIPFSSLVPLSYSFRWRYLVSLKWCGYSRNVIAIRRKNGWVKEIVISPDDPEAFVRTMKRVSGADHAVSDD